MKAALYRSKGAARDVLEIADVEKPVPQTGEVLVRLHFSGINPSDVKMRQGLSLGGMAMAYDYVIPHSDGSGIIEAICPSIKTHNIDDPVYVFNGGFKRAFGTAAEYITLPAQQVAQMPTTASLSPAASLSHGACFGIPLMTAVHAMTRAPSLDGKRVLISSGGGVVGRYCIEVARALGAKTIITTAASPQSQQTAANAGADIILDYNSPSLAADIMDSCGGIDHAAEAEFGSNIDTLAAVMAEGGTIAAYGSALNKTPNLPFYDFMFKNVSLHMMLVYLLDTQTRSQHIKLIESLLDEGHITENIAQIFPLDSIVEAHETVERGGKSGSVLIEMPLS